jgi:CheY-like chemotaxis protein
MNNLCLENFDNLPIIAFVYSPETDQIEFQKSPSRVVPAPDKQIFTFEDFSQLFQDEDKEALRKFLAKDNWGTKALHLTLHKDKGNKDTDEICSISLYQGKAANSSFPGLLQNLNPILPENFLYDELVKFANGLQTARKITHDLNNQFQIIAGFGSALEEEVTDPELKDCAENVMNAVMKAIELNKDMRHFFPKKIKPKFFQVQNNSKVESNATVNSEPKVEKTETNILVIDDEPLVQRFLCEMLKRLKFVPEGCTEGSEAIDKLAADKEKYDLAIIDMNLPDICSEELFNKLHEIKDNLKVILISGDQIGEKAQRMLDNGANGFLQKPTTVKVLQETIKEILAS